MTLLNYLFGQAYWQLFMDPPPEIDGESARACLSNWVRMGTYDEETRWVVYRRWREGAQAAWTVRRAVIGPSDQAHRNWRDRIHVTQSILDADRVDDFLERRLPPTAIDPSDPVLTQRWAISGGRTRRGVRFGTDDHHITIEYLAGPAYERLDQWWREWTEFLDDAIRENGALLDVTTLLDNRS